jgi:UDP-N-acetylmuramoylalanine-D-glutamate ligase
MLQDFSPKLFIGLFNNIYPCHLDWHFHSWNIYKEAKLNILQNAQYKIIQGDFSMDADIARIKGNKTYFSSKGKYTVSGEDIFYEGKKIISAHHIALLGEHNRKNITGVMSVLEIITQDSQKNISVMQELLKTFK